MKTFKLFLVGSFIMLSTTGVFAQPNSPVLISAMPTGAIDMSFGLSGRGWKKELFNSYENEYRIIGSYKVKGNSLLFKGYNVADIFTKNGYARNVSIMLDSYNQNFGVLIDNNTSLLNIGFNEIDSFQVHKDTAGTIHVPAKFINASIIDKNKKFFLQKLTNGSRYSLYKSYKAEMQPAGENIAQTDLQEFKIISDYYFLDNTSPKGYKKIKASSSALKDEFKDNKEAIAFLNNGSFDNENKEAKMVAFFDMLK